MKKLSLTMLMLVVQISIAHVWHSPAQEWQSALDTIKLAEDVLAIADSKKSPDLSTFFSQFSFHIERYKVDKKPASLKAAQEALRTINKEQDLKLAALKSVVTEDEWMQLQAEIHVLQYQAKRDLDIFGIKEKLGKLFAKYSTNLIKNQINKQNPHKDEVAYVRQDSLMQKEEANYCSRRHPYVKRALGKFFNKEIKDEQVYATGFVGTGGGYRAMILTTGYARGLERLGLLDSLNYMTSLSGSTWFLAPWIFSGKSVAGYKDELRAKAADEFFDIKDLSTILCTNPLNLINDIIWPKFIFGQSVSSIDIYGALLALVLFYDLGGKRQEQHLSEQWELVKDGSKPFPIYTSVSMHNMKSADYYDYNWYEFNPLEVRNLDLDIHIPAWAFDSHFDCGQSLEVAPEQSMGYLMGLFGSAYTVNFVDINRILFSNVEHAPSWADPLEHMKFKVAKRLVALMSNVPVVGKSRFSPAQVNNPFSRATDFNIPKWLTKKDELTFVDAGIDYNLPIRPLLRPCRNVKAVIVGESSGSFASAKELYKFFKDAQQHYGYEYEEVSAPSESIRFFKAYNDEQAPRVIYVNYHLDKAVVERAQADPELARMIADNDLENFDAVSCLSEQCGTMNFDYTEEQFLQLSAVAEFNMLAHHDEIREFLATECLA